MNVELSSLQFTWILRDDVANTTAIDFNLGSGSGGGMDLQAEDYIIPQLTLDLTLDLTIDVVNVTNADTYTCGSTLIDSLGVMINASSDFSLIVQCELILI